MGIRVALQHRTEYRYDRPIHLAPQVVRLRPAPHCRTPIRSYSLNIKPKEHFLNWQQDPQGNYLARLTIPEKTDHFMVHVDLIAEMVVINPFDFFLEEYANNYPFDYDPGLAIELKPYMHIEPASRLLQKYLDDIPRDKMLMNNFLVMVNQKLERDINYTVRMEPGVQMPEETLMKKSGSCRDSAWLLIQILRHLGLAARFVSGYLIQLAPDEPPVKGPPGPSADFTDLHAWAEVYLPGAGWVGLDPTSGLFAGEGHLPLACTPGPTSAAPITGATEKAETEFSFHMDVQRLNDPPRSTKPINDTHWEQAEALARRIDLDLNERDVRLTMGGEPTFVSALDREDEQWHTGAVGEDKFKMASELFNRLSNRFGSEGVQYVGQGKWYPGESLPRWSLECFWAKDGQPLWKNPELRGNPTEHYGHAVPEAQSFINALSERLDVETKHVRPAFEDVFYYLWRERTLPVNVDPFDSKLADKEERARLLRVFDRGLDKEVGYALPLRPLEGATESQWETGPWVLRDDRLLLLPGDAAMGYRLPLESLPWETDTVRQVTAEADPMGIDRKRQPTIMSTAGRHNNQSGSMTGHEAAQAEVPSDDAEGPVLRTALCVEPRDGRLYVFIPPLKVADDYFALISAIEDAAESTGMPVIIEGYGPPSDPRINQFSIQPDPGVIEVNIHPASNWQELKDITEGIYKDAAQVDLTTEKFGVDGRPQGTGGGAHIVMGGPSAAESPFIRRPDLLASMVRFWHNHPGLSYLFSGMFIGPTSQSPRFDEGRRDMVPELEIALRSLEAEKNTMPWLGDRTFRNLLVDVTGNTHRAEFCIDKLFSPDSPGGRRGLLEMRGFEMPPHPRMNLLQQAFVRGAVSAFWEQPYLTELVRWQTILYDRFMLPEFIWGSFKDALGEIRRRDYEFESEWFRSQYEFRFPKVGEVDQDGVHLELRGALEPWHVLGEQGAIGGTARIVDTSTERLQVKVSGMTDPRHVITCNGRKVPLHPTGIDGEYVAGVRYRAWQPAQGFHPNITPHSPLVFDIVDTWSNKAINGCTYWSSHPGGRNYETFPVNKEEAEARRISRFAPMGHSQGKIIVGDPECPPESPMTLDLRRI